MNFTGLTPKGDTKLDMNTATYDDRKIGMENALNIYHI